MRFPPAVRRDRHERQRRISAHSAKPPALRRLRDQDGGRDRPAGFPAAWVEAFAENPKASFPWLAAKASKTVSDHYQNTSMAQLEHARLADPVTGTILEPPFGVDLEARPEVAASPGNSTPSAVDIADIEVKMNDPNAVWEDQPATGKQETHRRSQGSAQPDDTPPSCSSSASA